MEAVLHKYIFVVKTFHTLRRFAYPYASLPSGLLLRRPFPFRTDVNGRNCVICESLEGRSGGELFGSELFSAAIALGGVLLARPTPYLLR